MTDVCIRCSLPLRRCGSCRGVAGPSDRHRGFCGHNLAQGRRRAPAWRPWLLAALVPLAAGIVFGVSPPGRSVARQVTTQVAASTPTPPVAVLRDPATGVGYSPPRYWTASDQGGFLVLTHWSPDARLLADAGNDLFAIKPQSGVIEIGRPPIDPAAGSLDPRLVLEFQVRQLLAAPPGEARLEIARTQRTFSVGGRPAAEVVLELSRGDGSAGYFVRAWIAAPSGPVRVDALVPAAAWNAGERARVEQVIRTIRG